ncbi:MULTISPECIES: DUF4946 domain-containing protein [unclassified Pseudomonas]|uniref:DUF4946 domain-containing protein n=1 Tax=unclassified Pseudomonas TaxID=196821 RepID=UPI000B8562B5|nr:MULTISPECIES: DUF4946 domain-containing protein [unclassified Pseudomonas]
MIRAHHALLVLTCLLAGAVGAQEATPQISWPTGWQVQTLDRDDSAVQASTNVSRQRAVKHDENGDPVLVMELTTTAVETGHEVNVQGVLLEMRKAIQKDFFQGGYQSACNRIHPATLSRLQALETTCTITQNGRHVLSQTIVAAVDSEKAYVFSYAGQAEAYAASQDEVQGVRNSLKF